MSSCFSTRVFWNERLSLKGAPFGRKTKLKRLARFPSFVAFLSRRRSSRVSPAITAFDRGAHSRFVAEARDLEEHRSRFDVGAPTFGSKLVRDLEKRQRLRHRDARLSDGVGDLLLRVRVLGLERGVAFGLLEGMKILSVEVLDQGELDDLVFGHVELDARHLGQPGFDRGAQPALPRDDLEAAIF